MMMVQVQNLRFKKDHKKVLKVLKNTYVNQVKYQTFLSSQVPTRGGWGVKFTYSIQSKKNMIRWLLTVDFQTTRDGRRHV